jgi:hypothetical protein
MAQPAGWIFSPAAIAPLLRLFVAVSLGLFVDHD